MNNLFQHEERSYGQNYLLRDYCGYPRWLPLPCHCEHGIYMTSKPLISDIKFPNNHLMLVMNKNRLNEWQKKTSIDAVVIGSLFVHYRKKHNIRQQANASGTLVFAAHSTALIDAIYNIDSFCDDLKKLPEKFLPITICLHGQDILKGRDRLFINAGFNVVSAGDTKSSSFAKNLYSILAMHKYVASNVPGSYLFYAIEMGIPFFFIGQEVPRMCNFGNDPNVPKNYIACDFDIARKCYEVFANTPTEEITQKQREFVSSMLGISDSIKPKKLLFLMVKKVIFKNFVLNFFELKRKLSAKICQKIPFKRNLLFMRNYFYLLRFRLLRANRIFTHLTLNEKIILHRLVRKVAKIGPIAVEIGSYLGSSSCFIANGIKKKQGTLYCVDTWENQTMPEGERDTFGEFSVNTRKYSQLIVPLRGWSDVVINDLRKKEKKGVDFLFIDGDHSYESCKKDWELYSPLLKQGAIVTFHDTGWAEGVKQVVQESVLSVADCIVTVPNMQVFKIKEKKNV